MTDTLPFTGNRIAAHFETPEPELPKTARERGKLWSDIVFQAVLALKHQLRSTDAHIVNAAAGAILELERTRMRHAKNLAGSESVSQAQEEFEAEERDVGERQHARCAAAAVAGESEDSAAEPTVSRALAEHAREARRVFTEMHREMTEEESLEFTAGFLRHLGRDADGVSKADFGLILRKMKAGAEREKVAA